MRTLAATALLACASADETSLMQSKVKRSSETKLSVAADSTSSRQDSTSKLLDTAVNMIKNGVTPDVITFVDATNQDINEEVLVAIQSEHDIDQAYINSLCQAFLDAVQALEEQAAQIEVHNQNADSHCEEHHSCRAQEAMACAHSRRCEEQLRQKWEEVKHEERIMREIHGWIHDEWCIHPPFFAEIDAWLDHPFNWAQTSPYPILDLPQDVRDFRHVSVDYFTRYMEQKIVVERVWREYNEKLVECAGLEETWESQIPVCDAAQNTCREHSCEHAQQTRQSREQFGQEWARITSLFEQARIAKTANEQARKNEWETLKIVQCLLDHVHSSVITSIETGAPCPTIDSDPDGVTLAIEDCHIVTRGCGEDSMTAHLCLDWCDEPPIPPLPPVEEPACTPAFVAQEQAQFLAHIQTMYTEQLMAADTVYPNDPLAAYETVLSPAGWAGCAPPLVCVDCASIETQSPCLEHTGGAHTCHLHEEYLSPGQSNADTFKCLDGTCIAQAGRCNQVANCADESDEMGCDDELNHFVPAYVAQEFTCPDDFHDDVHFRCGTGTCVEKVGLCNGIPNCNDGSDESQCSGGIHVTVEATSGRTITVETAQSSTGVFHDRDYSFDSLGRFQGKTFIKYSNDDKMTDGLHVMTKLRTVEPLTVYIVKLENHGLSWLETEGYTWSDLAGVSFSGVRSTRHKEWDESLLTTDNFAAYAVYKKTFPAGTISIPGNNGGDGSFLIFVDRPAPEPHAAGHYHYGTTGDNACVTHAVSESECLAAVESLPHNLPGSSHLPQGRTSLVAGSWGWVPPGCSVQSHFTHGQDGDWAAHYNRNPGGQNDGGYTPVCSTVEDVEWTLVLQYGATSYTLNAGAVGTLNEAAKQHAKMSDSAINALPSGGAPEYDYYMLTSEAASTGASDVVFMRTQGAYSDTSPTLGWTSWEACYAADFDACTWSPALGGSLGIDTYYPGGRNTCDRWFTGYQNRILCYNEQGTGGRCWSSGASCGHATRQDVKMYRKTA